MKKILGAICLILLLVMATGHQVLAQEAENSALSYEELMGFVSPYLERAKQETPLNSPIGTDALSEDGYAYIYDFATLYFDKPTLDDETRLNALVVVSENEELPRGINIDATFEELIDAFYSENDSLQGSYDFAYLYLSDTMPMGAMWAFVQRQGQQAQVVQYAVHDQLVNRGDGYTDSGLIYTIQAGTVVALRAYGLNTVISEEQVRGNISHLEAISDDTSYFMYKKSLTGDDVDAFEREDLTFSGIDFLTATPEDCQALLGSPMEDVWMQDGNEGHLRTLTFESAQFTFSYDINKQNGRMEFADLYAPGIEGPRGARVGERFSEVFQRFMHSQVPYDGSETVVLYGNLDSGRYGAIDMWSSEATALRYATDEGIDQPVTLFMLFEKDELIEIMIHY